MINVQVKKTVNDKSALIKLFICKINLNPNVNNQDILKLMSLLNYRVVVERPRKSKIIVHCKRCQGIRYSQNYCNKTSRCVKCGEKHLTKDFSKTKDVPSKCVKSSNTQPPLENIQSSKINRLHLHRKLTTADRIKQRVTPAQASIGNTSDSYETIVDNTKAHKVAKSYSSQRNQPVSR